MTIDISDEKEQAKHLSEILGEMYSPKNVIDIGCNEGLYLEGFSGCKVLGIDFDAHSLAKATVPVIRLDITKPLDLPRYDLAICLEVLEHIPSEDSDAVLDNICRASDTIVFTAAQPGAGGVGHINCQPKDHWRARFKDRGYEEATKETEYITQHLKEKSGIMGWLLDNLMILRKSGIPSKFKEKLRFHVVNLPHTQTTKEYLPCAYTQKVVNFCRMMMSLGHEVFLYASEDNDAPCTELITAITKDQQRSMLKENDWKKDFFAIDWDSNLAYWKTMNNKAIHEMKFRIKPRDFVCLIGGVCQKPIADAFPKHMTVEFGIGYTGVFSKYKVFESYAWMHHVYGLLKEGNGNSYDAVIPNYFDPADFPFSEKRDDYFLFIGRLISRKGPHVAHEVCKRIGSKLILAGQGVQKNKDGTIQSSEITLEGGDIEHVGTVDVKRRGELMSKAKAVFVQTQYIGPFEGVHVEAMMCGTPVITTDWGVFSETVLDGHVGFRTRTLGEAIWAAKKVDSLDKKSIRNYAIDRFSIDVIKYRYQDYFKQLLGLWSKGWYEEEYDPSDKREHGKFV